MSSLIKNLRIQNFKSIRDLSLDCERINVFIGKPNAGKSNILEAVSLLGVNYDDLSGQKFLETVLRYNSLNNLFNNFDTRNTVNINADDESIALLEVDNSRQYDYIFINGYKTKSEREKVGVYRLVANLLNDGTVKEKSKQEPKFRISPIKRYEFRGLLETQMNGSYLKPPHGDNFYSIVESHPPLREEIKQFLAPNGLELLLDINSRRMTIVQKTENTLISFPLTLVPDTFQRYIFHLAAIMSNRDSVLLFEEPESHSYGPYIYQLSQRIIDDEGGNQFFLTTHNPYFLLPLMREQKDVAVFTTWFENYETHAKRLSEHEIDEIIAYGIDIFYNLDSFIPG